MTYSRVQLRKLPPPAIFRDRRNRKSVLSDLVQFDPKDLFSTENAEVKTWSSNVIPNRDVASANLLPAPLI
jgi:hypothetical protein